MIKGSRKETLSKEAILRRISSYDIYRKFFGEFKPNSVTNNWMRKDKNPSFVIGNKNGELTHHDFADTFWNGDCISFVQQLNNCNFDTALRIIDQEFGIGITTDEDVGKYKKIVAEYKQPEELGKRYSLIQCITRRFTNEELRYWSEYFQSLDDLRTNNIYSIKELYLNKQKFPLKDEELRFGYLFEGEYWKIYRPLSEKKHKWLSNVPITCMDGKEDIKNCDVAFINKSKKDFLVMKKVFPCSCGVQNESIGCFSTENVEYLKNNSKRQILSFDSDVPGVTNSQQITKLFNFDYCNVPRKYLQEGIKDWSDLAKNYNLELIETILKEKGIYYEGNRY